MTCDKEKENWQPRIQNVNNDTNTVRKEMPGSELSVLE